MITKRYRQDYAGEYIVLRTTWSGGKKDQEREWIPNPIDNQHISHRAACIGTSVDREQFFDYRRLEKHRGGLLSSKKLQTYGTGSILKEMRLDFSAELNPDQLKELKDSKYDELNIIYTSSKNCMAHPGHFYLIPYSPHFVTEVMPVYLAAFDGHEEIFLLGYTNDSPIEHSEWADQIYSIMKTYSGTKFFVIGEKTNLPAKLFDNANAQAMDYREFINYCDV